MNKVGLIFCFMILTPFLGYADDRSSGSKMGIIPKPFEMISGAGSFELNYHTAIYFGKGARESALDSELPSPGVRHTLGGIGTSCATEARESGTQIQMTYKSYRND